MSEESPERHQEAQEVEVTHVPGEERAQKGKGFR